MQTKGIAIAVLATTLLACGTKTSDQGPEVASASGQEVFAAQYSTRVDEQVKELARRESEARTSMDGWEKLPAELGDTKTVDVKALYEKADEAGKSSSYVNERRQIDGVRAFYTEEKDEIGRRVAGGVDHAAQQKGCETRDLGGVATYSMREAIDKRLEARLRRNNEAQLLLEDERATLDKATAERLEKQMDEVANTSFLVHVGIVETRNELRRYHQDAGHVKDTLDRSIESEKAKLADAQRSDSSKKTIQARIEHLEEERGKIDATTQNAQQSLQSADERIRVLQEDYKTKFKALLERLEVKK